eukprot:Gb_24422 [translate_table: standard]
MDMSCWGGFCSSFIFTAGVSSAVDLSCPFSKALEELSSDVPSFPAEPSNFAAAGFFLPPLRLLGLITFTASEDCSDVLSRFMPEYTSI